MHWRLIGTSLILLAACNAKEREPAPAETEARPEVEAEPALPDPPVLPPVGSRVLLGKGRSLAIEPKPDAARVYSMATQPRIAEVVGHVGGEFIELRSVAVPNLQVCAASGTDRSFEIRFFATLDDLKPVLGVQKQVEFDDGTKLAFAPGVAVVGEGADARLRVGNIVFEVPLATDEIARWFQPLPIAWPLGSAPPPSEFPLHYGDHEIPTTRDFQFQDPFAKQSIEGGTLLSFVNACGQFTLRIDADLGDSAYRPEHGMKGPKEALPTIARDFDPDMAGQRVEGGHFGSAHGGALAAADDDDVWGGLTGCGEATWAAPEATKLLWRETGTEAGVVIEETRLPSDAHELDDKICFAAADAAVCIESSRLRREVRDCDYGGDDLVLIGKGSSKGFGGRGKRVPQVRQVKAEVSPGLDHDIVRRIVRAHINEVRSCYNAGLSDSPELAGRVVIEFEIAASGKVSASKVAKDELEPANDTVGACVAKAVARWTFPRPKAASSVSVVYPFDLSPG